MVSTMEVKFKQGREARVKCVLFSVAGPGEVTREVMLEKDTQEINMAKI